MGECECGGLLWITRMRQDGNWRGDLLVTLMDATESLTADDPLRVPAVQADWFLDDWLKVPEAWRTDRRYLSRRRRLTTTPAPGGSDE